MLKKDVTEKVKRKANELSDLCIKDGSAFAKSYKELYDRGEFNCGECFVISRLVDIYAAVKMGSIDRNEGGKRQRELFDTVEIEEV